MCDVLEKKKQVISVYKPLYHFLRPLQLQQDNVELNQGVVYLPEQRVILNTRLFQEKVMIKNWIYTDLFGAQRTKDKKIQTLSSM